MTSNYLIVDAHEDLAWNMLALGRDYSRSAVETRRLELDTETPTRNGDTLLGWKDYQAGQVGVVFSTLFASPRRHPPGGWDSQVYRDFEEANHLYWNQIEQYQRFVGQHPDQFRLIKRQTDLKEVLAYWQAPLPAPKEAVEKKSGCPVGMVILMEGAEGVRSPAELEEWWEAGVRIIGPAWLGTRYCGGTSEPGPMTSAGWALLEGMQSIGFTLDISHMDEKAALQALDGYAGRIIASHANAMALLNGIDNNRHLSNPVIEKLAARQGVMGIVPFNPFLKVGWKASDGKKAVSLEAAAAHIDFVCQLVGNARHVGLGSDFDGGVSYQSTPKEINTIADLQQLAPLLHQKGYSEADIAAIFGQNWLTFLEQTLP
jgi:membrane dipeptidase